MKNLRQKKKNNDSNEGGQFKKRFNLNEKIIYILLFIAASAAIIFSIAILYSLADGAIKFFTDPVVNIIEFHLQIRFMLTVIGPAFQNSE